MPEKSHLGCVKICPNKKKKKRRKTDFFPQKGLFFIFGSQKSVKKMSFSEKKHLLTKIVLKGKKHKKKHKK